MVQAPNWCKNAVPTSRGWEDPRTGELYVSKRFSQAEIDEFHGVQVAPVVVEQVVHEEPQMLHEAPVGNKSLDKMTKVELVALAEQMGVEVTPKDTKSVLVEKLS
jgi:hypothetical protein